MTDHIGEWRQAAYKAVRERDEARAERDRLKARGEFLREMLNLLSVSYVPTDQVLRWLDRPEPPSAALLEQPEFPLPIRPDGTHFYVSTYCAHSRHAECRLTCLCCGQPCQCTGCAHGELCSICGALVEPLGMVLHFRAEHATAEDLAESAPLRTPATPAQTIADIPLTSGNTADIEGASQ